MMVDTPAPVRHHRVRTVTSDLEDVDAVLDYKLGDTQGRIDPAAWHTRCLDQLPVGWCGRCNGPLLPGPADQTPTVTWYPSTCTECGHEYLHPAGKQLDAPAGLGW